MAIVTVKSGNVSATCEDGGVIFRSNKGQEIKFSYDDFEVLSSAVREKKYQMERQKNKKHNPKVEASY